MTLSAHPLPQNWTLAATTSVGGRPPLPQTIPASVPGTVHTDLIAAGLLADPYLDLNEIRADWVGRQDWRYGVDFDWAGSAHSRVDLVCEGLDTFATLTLNGQELGRTRNMHRSWRFDLRSALQQGPNHLDIGFRSAYAEGEDLAQGFGDRPNNYPGPGNLMRKMACNFGWDWGPTLVTSGIWKPIRLEAWSIARLASVRPDVTVIGANGYVVISVSVERDGFSDEPLSIAAEIDGISVVETIPAGAGEGRIEFFVPSPRLWWPAGIGAQPLYDLNISLHRADGATLDTWHKRVGFRSVRLDTSADDKGAAFTLVINDVPVWINGANWIPDDCFLPRVTPERYRQRVGQAKDANINLLRVWGGGIYETEAFYTACDEAGILVWQDFLFACATYPEEGELPAEIEAEARENVARLMPHPSLVLWNGNNENIWGWFDWGWQDALDGQSWGLGYYTDLLPRIVAEVDPSRPYWAGSPYSGNMDIHPNDPDHGCSHIWNVWNDVGYEHYRDVVPRFCSEFGWQAPPTWATLMQAIHDDPLTPTSPGVAHHQKATNGNEKLLRGLAGHLPMPQSMDDWHFVTQLNQARAIRFGIEHMRSHRGTCMGALVWQLNDCWPVNSWSAIDGYGRKKPLWHALKASFSDHLLTIQPRGDGLHVIAVNERTLFWRSPVKLQRVRFDGTVLAEHVIWRLSVDRFSAQGSPIPETIARADNPAEEMIVAEMLDSKVYWFFAEDIALDLPPMRYELAIRQEKGDWLVTVLAQTFLRDLVLYADRLHPDADVDTMMVNLLPGESHTFRVASPVPVTMDMIWSPGVLRCVNQLPKGEVEAVTVVGDGMGNNA